METQSDQQLGALKAILTRRDLEMEALRRIWVGRVVKVVRPLRAKGQPVLDVGDVGRIVDVRDDEYAPFTVQFNRVPIKIAPLLDRIEIVS